MSNCGVIGRYFWDEILFLMMAWLFLGLELFRLTFHLIWFCWLIFLGLKRNMLFHLALTFTFELRLSRCWYTYAPLRVMWECHDYIPQPCVISRWTELCSRWIPRALKQQITATSARMSHCELLSCSGWWHVVKGYNYAQYGAMMHLHWLLYCIFLKKIWGILFQEPPDSQALRFICKTNSVNTFDHILIFDSHSSCAGAYVIPFCLEELTNGVECIQCREIARFTCHRLAMLYT